MPITSFGIIVYRMHPIRGTEYLMICRKDTLGYIDFMRGKYVVQNKQYIMNMLKQMTVDEKNGLLTGDFDMLWKKLWGESSNYLKYKKEELISKEKYETLLKGYSEKRYTGASELQNSHIHSSTDYSSLRRDVKGVVVKPASSTHSVEQYTLASLIQESYSYGVWKEPEWGFPKGRPKFKEKDLTCAIREFAEETGYQSPLLKHIYNIHPFEEIFTGSNYKSYRHKYFLMYMDYTESLTNTSYEKIEISKMEWKTYEECLSSIRTYNLEKKKLVMNIHHLLSNNRILFHSPS